MYWIRSTSKAWGEGAKGGSKAVNKVAFRELVADGPPPGLLAYAGEEPVAWCRVMPRSRHPGLKNSRHFKTELDLQGVWSLSCFVVQRAWRGRGLTTVLTKAAIRFAREQGAQVLEVYPTDTDEKKHPSVIYTGKATTFVRLGFEEVQRRSPHKPMMRLVLS
jgi:GNAT superfamily N-acetyltransferase